MIDWAELTLFLYITARISGFVLFNPVLGRRNIPGIFRSGLILVLSVFVISFTAPAAVRIPGSVVEMGLRILLELALGYLLGLVMNFFFYIPQLAGHAIDTQMGMTMNQVYDASAQANLSVSSVLLNTLMTLLFFAAGGHHTLLRMMLTYPGRGQCHAGALCGVYPAGGKAVYAHFGGGAAGAAGNGRFDEGHSANQCIFHQY